MRDPYENRIGRNDPCWCGSGKKFKRCHAKRQHVPKMTKQDMLQEWRRIVETEECSHPDAPHGCNGAIIRAHTIQRSGGLSRIAEGNHVLQIRQDLTDLIRSNGRLAPVRVGCKEASTFRGFCSGHDTCIFGPIETQPLTFTDEQCFLLGYRAMCFAYYAKKHIHTSVNKLIEFADAGCGLSDQALIQQLAQGMKKGGLLGIKDLTVQKDQHEDVLKAGTFSTIGYCVFEIDRCPDVLCSSLVTVDQDFTDDRIQDFRCEESLDCVALSLVPTDTAGAIVFSWVHDASGSIRRFIDSLLALRNTDVPDAVIRFAFSYCDNVCMSPVWWNALPSITREALQKRIGDNVIGLAEPRTPARLKDDGIRAVTWKVTRRHIKWPDGAASTV